MKNWKHIFLTMFLKHKAIISQIWDDNIETVFLNILLLFSFQGSKKSK